MLRSDASKTTNVKGVDRSGSKDGQTTFSDPMGPEPIHQAQHADIGLQACCQLLHAMGLEPIRTDSMNPLGCKPIDIQLCRALAARPQGTVRLPVRWPPRTCVRRTPLGPWVNGLCASRYANRQASAVPQRRATQASSQQPCTNREWCPASLVVPIALRRGGRTETLTRPLHTHTQVRAFTDTEARPADR